MFFGRDDALIWVEQQLTLDRRLLIVYGADLIGKTSLVCRLSPILAGRAYCVHFECKPQQGKSLSRVLAALAAELASQLMARGLVSPHQIDTAADSATAVTSLLRQAAPALDGRKLLLVLDDVHYLAGNDATSYADLFDFLTALLADVPPAFLLLTLSDLSYGQLAHPMLLGAATFRLGPLGSDAAQQLITRPAQGALRFDSGVVKRIAEITSNHPYYLHLFCYELYSCCAREGWINQSDVDRVLDMLLSLPNERFQAIWNRASWAEQVALTGLAGLRGAHGPVTRQEVINYLRRFEPDITASVILDALESLADKGVLIRMGALSYRFAVNLFRYWLDRHTDPAEILVGAGWERLGAQRITRPAAEVTGSAESARTSREEEAQVDGRRWNVGLLSILGLTGTALVGLALLALVLSGALPLDEMNPTPTEMPTPMAGGSITPFPSPTPSVVPTVTPTRPLIVAHSLPAIVYMARGSTSGIPPATWELFVMDADGTNRQQRTATDADNITPIWSPDGKSIAFVSQRDGNREIYLTRADSLAGAGSAELINITRHPAEDWTPAWSPDGRHISFSSNRQGNWEIFTVSVDGTGLRQITSDGYGNLSPSWSPDGRTMVYSSKRDGNWEIYTMPAPDAQGEVIGQPRRLTFSEGNDLSPVYSPQGDRIAFESNRGGNVEIYGMDADGSNQRNLSSLPYADEHGPVWSPDGQKLLFYSNRDGSWDLFVMSPTGENILNLTNTPDVDEQAPAWRP